MVEYYTNLASRTLFSCKLKQNLKRANGLKSFINILREGSEASYLSVLTMMFVLQEKVLTAGKSNHHFQLIGCGRIYSVEI